MIKKFFKSFLQIFNKEPLQKELAELRKNTFSNILVEELMIPRSDIDAVKHDITLVEICKVFIEKEHTRVPVYKEELDNILGFIHIKDIFKIVALNSKFNLNAVLRKPIITTPSKKILDLFNEMRKNRVHIALVVDEYGGTKGLITIEDIIEEEMGDIDDEYDDEDEDDCIAKNNHFLASGRAKIEDIKEKLQIDFEEDKNEEYETIAGMIISRLQAIPKVGEQINIDNKILCTIVESNPRMIKKIKIEIIEDKAIGDNE